MNKTPSNLPPAARFPATETSSSSFEIFSDRDDCLPQNSSSYEGTFYCRNEITFENFSWVLTDDYQTLLHIDAAAAALFGVKPEQQTQGKLDWPVGLHPDDRVRIEAEKSKLRSDGWVKTIYRIIDSAGKIRWIEDVWSLQESISEGTRLVAGVSKDITLKRQITTINEEMVAVLENSFDLIIAFGADNKIKRCSRSINGLLGYEPHALVGKTIQEIMTSGDRLHPDLFNLESLATPSKKDFLFKKADRSVVSMECNISKLISPIPAEYLLVARPRSNPNELIEKLVSAHRKAGLNEVTRFMIHEFNNIMTVIQMQADMIRHLTGPAHGIGAKGVGSIKRAVAKANDLCQTVLGIIQPQGEPKLCQIDHHSQALQFNIFRQILKKIAVVFTLEPKTFQLQATEFDLDSIILNLAFDAFETMPHGGLVSVKTELLSSTQSSGARLSQTSAGDYYCIHVEYSGRIVNHTPSGDGALFLKSHSTFSETISLKSVLSKVERLSGWVDCDFDASDKKTLRLYLPANRQTPPTDRHE